MKKKLLYFGILVLITVSVFLISLHYRQQLPPCLFVGDTQISVDIADTPPSRVRGLSGRSSLFDIEGMLFLFPRDGNYGFWMKDMNFPIDIIWLNKDWTVIEVTPSLDPSSYPETVYPSVPVRSVLEVSAGFVERHGVEVGDRITLCSKTSL